MLCSNKYFRAATFSTKLLLQKRYFLQTATFGISQFLIFHSTYFFWRASFSKYLLFYSRYVYRKAAISQHTFSEEVSFHSYTSIPQLNCPGISYKVMSPTPVVYSDVVRFLSFVYIVAQSYIMHRYNCDQLTTQNTMDQLLFV